MIFSGQRIPARCSSAFLQAGQCKIALLSSLNLKGVYRDSKIEDTR